MSVKVFVYGTLRTGDCRFGVPSFVEMIAPEAYLENFDMLDLGGFPGLVPDGSGRVRGEVHEYENLETLDRIEGYRAEDPTSGLYSRRQVTVETPDGDIEDCWVYTFNLKGRMERVIESGDWFEHRGFYEKLGIEHEV